MRIAVPLALVLCAGASSAAPTVVPAEGIRGKVLCGYQGWFRCPGDAAAMGWVHWSRDWARIAPETLTFEMWPDVSEYPADALADAPDFTHPDGAQARLYSSDHAGVVLRHFEWMRDYGIDGVWLQHFAVDLPGAPLQVRYPSRRRVMEHVRSAAGATGRVWALSYDISGMPLESIYDVVTADWRRLVDEGIPADPRYLHEGGRPVVQVWGFYEGLPSNRMTPALANRLIDFFQAEGAYLVGGGDWNWRRSNDPEWPAFVRRFDAYCPWNIGNYRLDAEGMKHAATQYWAEDKHDLEEHGVLWIPVLYPGFSWDNLTQKPPGTSLIARRRGDFLWEQFEEARALGCDAAYIAMFDEVDEGTAIFKVTSAPPTEAHFVGYEGLPSDWYLRLVGAGRGLLLGEPGAGRPEIPAP